MTSTPYRANKYKNVPGEKERIMRNTRALQIRNRDLARSIKAKSGCVRCGFKDVRALQFHHRNPAEKEFGVTVGIARCYSKERLLAEIAKCDVLCANCHSIEHYRE